MTRVIAIGLDAAEPALVEDLTATGALPHLARLRARAAHAPLRSPSPFRSESPWTEFTTGRRAGTLRYWSTVAFDPTAYDAYMRGAAPDPPFYAFGPATTVVAFDLPKVVRAPAVTGAQILGWGAHSPQYPAGSSPPGLLAEIEARFGPHPGLPIEYAGTWHQHDYLERFGVRQAEGVRRRGDILRWLADRTPGWQLLATLVGECHQTGHVTYHGFGGLLAGTPSAPTGRAALTTVLRAVDDLVGDVVSWAPPDAVIVVFSVHGMGPADDDIAGTTVPELLLRAGTGHARLPVGDLTSWRRQGMPPVVPAGDDSPVAWTRRRFAAPAATGVRARARARARDVVARRAPAVLAARHRRRRDTEAHAGPSRFPFHDRSMDDWHLAAWYRDAWPRMPAFAIPSYSDVHVRINLAGRERDGIVDADGYATACAEVERVLGAARDARTGEPLVVEITRRRPADPFDPDGPPADLVVRLRGTDAVEHPDLGTVGPMVAPRTGSHTAHGFATIAGPRVHPGVRGEHSVADVSATICALLGREPPFPLDGTRILDCTELG